MNYLQVRAKMWSKMSLRFDSEYISADALGAGRFQKYEQLLEIIFLLVLIWSRYQPTRQVVSSYILNGQKVETIKINLFVLFRTSHHLTRLIPRPQRGCAHD